jgi:hypothetical protein
LPIRAWVDRYAAALVGTTKYTSDLAIPAELNEEFAALVDRPLRAYHCTRLRRNIELGLLHVSGR